MVALCRIPGSCVGLLCMRLSLSLCSLCSFLAVVGWRVLEEVRDVHDCQSLR